MSRIGKAKKGEKCMNGKFLKANYFPDCKRKKHKLSGMLGVGLETPGE